MSVIIAIYTGVLLATVAGSKHDFNRPNQGRVCIYCHTPHNANPNSNAYYLWNRAYMPSGPFTLYDATYTDPMTNASFHTFMCLSCHDGTQTAADMGELYTDTLGVGTAVQDPPDITSGTQDSLITTHPVDMDVAPGILPSSDFNAPSGWPGNNLPLFDFSSISHPSKQVQTLLSHVPHAMSLTM